MNRGGIDELPTGLSEYDRAEFWIERRAFVDEVLAKPARTLVRLVRRSLDRAAKDNGTFTVPVAIDDAWDEKTTFQGGSLLVHAVSCSAVQNLYDDRRRYAWIDPVRKDLESLHDRIPNAFLQHPALQEQDLLKRFGVLADPAFGNLNPMTAAEVFWVLVRAGERYAHGQVGFLALFSLLWALKRQTHGRFNAGAALGRWRPSAAVTARCLLPILQLTRIIDRRARYYRRALDLCQALHENEQAGTEFQRWRFASALEQLSVVLYKLAEISIVRKDVEDVAKRITELADPIAPREAIGPIAERVRHELRALFVTLGEQNESILGGAQEATHVLQQEMIGILGSETERRRALQHSCKIQPMWKEQIRGAKEANKVCAAALAELQNAVTKSKALPQAQDFTHEVLIDTLKEFTRINESVSNILRMAICDNEEWCRDTVTREIAYASAGNDSDFDATELLSGLVIAQRTEQITRGAVEDAVRHSLRAARSDGSWASNQPIYIEKHFVGVWPATSDLLFLLANAVHATTGLIPGPDVADRHLLRYAGLLEAKRRKKKPTWWTNEKEDVWGFPSEARETHVDVWATAMSVRALLKIREVIEDRLWEICENRFTIPRPERGLDALDPVDLGARHGQRLQTRLIRTAAKTRSGVPDAEYAYVLHGPPGSSKTAIAEAIGKEMWGRREPRFVRITPADFTRRGEDGVDYEARFIFRLLTHVREVTIFFDEIDDLLRKRKIDAGLSFIRLVIPGMLNRLQDLRDAAPRQQICFLLATNYVDQIEPALTRRGRIDRLVPIPYPDPWSRESILERNISEKKREGAEIDVPQAVKDAVVSKTAEWPWSTYQKLCRKVLEEGCRTAESVDLLVDQFRSEFEPADNYYRYPARWASTSPIINEFAHFAFGVSKMEHECRQRVTELEKYLRKNKVSVKELKLGDRFERAWKETQRG